LPKRRICGLNCLSRNLFGREGVGWRVVITALSYERSVMGESARGPRSGVGIKRREGEAEPVPLAREASRLDQPEIRQRIAQVTAWRRYGSDPAQHHCRTRAGFAEESGSGS
jgi:hypothetical protein